MKKLLAALLALLCLPVMTALGDMQGDFTYALTPEGAVGHNTDADGFLCALKAAGVPLKGRAALGGHWRKCV